jgi:hypothetical protein
MDIMQRILDPRPDLSERQSTTTTRQREEVYDEQGNCFKSRDVDHVGQHA